MGNPYAHLPQIKTSRVSKNSALFLFLCVCGKLFNADSCCLVLTSTSWNDILKQNSDLLNQEKKLCNSYKAINETEIFCW